MKAITAGLTFVNVATVSGILLGMIGGGVSRPIALLAILIGLAAAALAFHMTTDPEATRERTDRRRYGALWFWIMAAFFAIYAVRAFCWLYYIDGEEWKIQSPNNLGDLALHITYIKNFASGVGLWPENPIYVSSHLRYPAGVDFFNALLDVLRFDLCRSLTWVGLLASAATCYALFRWGGAFGIAGFLFNGGVVGFQILNGFWNDGSLNFVDYQGKQTIAWKSIPLSMFTTQRGLLYAIPAGLLLLWHWREKFFRSPVAGVADPGPADSKTDRNDQSARGPLPFWVELSLYASMPLFHFHTFLALSITLLCLFIMESGQLLFLDETKSSQRLTASLVHMLILVAAALLPATFFVALITDFFHAGSMVGWHIGWVMDDPDMKQSSSLAFWWLNFGLWFPLLALLFGVCIWRAFQNGFRFGDKMPEDLAWLMPAAVIFFLGMIIKFAPWGWDNLKLMIWGYFLILPYLWTRLIRPWAFHLRAAVCLVLFGSGFVSLFGGLVSGGHGFANRGEVDWLGVALQHVSVEARFAAFPTYNHPLLLQGRKVVAGYPGHLWTQGFADYGKVEQRLQDLMLGKPDWRQAAAQLRVRYIFWGREERQNYTASTRPWEQLFTPLANDPTWGAIYDLGPPR